ncbi:MAG: AAA family ATPase [Candidatus Poseidoniaceae archaeon]|nr:AAA family ATPase [Candidatus Poseidoniaceae archaeon]MBL6889535.1 AAA family ATPase [Candidatus Poseidoniaceae archaeon]
MLQMTISGHPGSGTSTLVSLLRESKGWSSLNGGELFRQEAKRRNMSLSEFGQLCKEDLEVDRQLDALLKEEMMRTDDEAPSIVESRLSGWWAYKLGLSTPRIWLEVDDLERAKRVQAREGGDLNSIVEANKQRSKVDEQRFEELYGLLPQQTEPYTHIINASDLNPQEVLALVLDILEE